MRMSNEQPQNVNINPRDYSKLQLGGQPGVTGGQGGLPGLLGLLAGNKNVVTPSFNPMQTIQDFINPQRMHPTPDGGLPDAPQMPQHDDSSSLYAQLQKLLGGGGDNFQAQSLPNFDPNRYKDQAEEAVNSQFSPILNQIYAQQKETQGRAKTNQGAVGDLYAQMAASLQNDAVADTKSYDTAQAKSKSMYDDERDKIAAGYAADAAAQRAAAKQLGTEALGVNDAIAKQDADKQFADQQMGQQYMAQQGALGQQGAAASTYDRDIAQATRQEGVNAQGDIMQQLQDYMSQSNSDIANTRAQQAGSTTDLMMKLADAAYQRDAANAQFGYQQQRDYIGDQKDLFQLQNDASQSGQVDASKLNPWQQTALFADQLKPGQGSDIVAAIQKAMNDRPEIYARSKQDPVAMNPALFAKLIADSQGSQNLDRNTLMQVSQELYRLLYGM